MSTSTTRSGSPSLEVVRPETSGDGREISAQDAFEDSLIALVGALSVAHAAIDGVEMSGAPLLYGGGEGVIEASCGPTGRRRVDRLIWCDVERILCSAAKSVQRSIGDYLPLDLEAADYEFMDRVVRVCESLRGWIQGLDFPDARIPERAARSIRFVVAIHFEAALDLRRHFEAYCELRTAPRGNSN